MALPEEKMIAPSKALLAEIEVFLDAHYDYRCLPKYKGFIGRLKAHFDKLEDDRKRAEREEYERIAKLSPKGVLYSDPGMPPLHTFQSIYMLFPPIVNFIFPVWE